jgi:hypothetical protein
LVNFNDSSLADEEEAKKQTRLKSAKRVKSAKKKQVE